MVGEIKGVVNVGKKVFSLVLELISLCECLRSEGKKEEDVAERISNHYLVRELFVLLEFEIIHFIQ